MSEAGLVTSGDCLGTRYRIRDHLDGDGRWSRWSAHDEVLDRPVTVLCFPETGVATATVDAARRAGGVNEDRLAQVLDAGTSDGVGYVVEQPTDGTCTLARVLQSRTLPAEEARRIVGEVANALSVADARGLHHLALSPRSVALVLDDGAVQVRGLGTEAALNGLDDTIDAPSATDARALIAILYASLTGHWPLAHPAPEGIGLHPAPWTDRQPGPPSGLISGLPAEFDDLVAEAWSGPDPADGTGGLRTPAAVSARLRPWSRIALLDYRSAFESSPPQDGSDQTRTKPNPAEPTPAEPRAPESTPTEPRAPESTPTESTVAEPTLTKPAPGSASASDLEPDPAVPATEVLPLMDGASAPEAAPVRAHGILPSPASEAPESHQPAPQPRPDPGPRYPARARLSEVLIETSDPLEPPAPRTAPRPIGSARPSAGLPLALVATLVLILGIIGFLGMPRIDLPQLTGLADAPRAPAAASPTSELAPNGGSIDLTPVAILQGASFEPGGDGQVPSAVAPAAWDGDPDTAWQSNLWFATADFGGLDRTGYGLIADLGQQTLVRQVTVTLPAAQDLTVYVTNQASLEGAIEIGSSTGQSGQLTFEVPGDPVSGQLVIVLITSLTPDGEGHFRAYVSEVKVYT